MLKKISTIISLFSLLLIVGCQKHDEPVSSVSVSPISKAIVVGESFTLSATISPSDAKNLNVVWLSSQPLVATVNNSGLVKGVSKGKTTITVATRDGNRRSTCEVTVSENIIPVKEIILDPLEASIHPGDELIISATISPEEASSKSLLWTSSNSEVAKVSKHGKVTAIAAGEVIIRAESEANTGISSECKIKIEDKDVPITGIKISPRTKKMLEGDEFELRAVLYPVNAKEQSIVWKSMDPNIVEVSKEGKLKAKNIGKTIVTASIDGLALNSSCHVSVIEKKERDKMAIEYFAEYDINKDGTDFTYSHDNSKTGHFNWYVLNGVYDPNYNVYTRNILENPNFNGWRLPTLNELRGIIPDLDPETMGHVNFTKSIRSYDVIEYIEINGITKIYLSDYFCNGNKITYGLRFKGYDNDYLAAYRYEYKFLPKYKQNALEVRVRYLGPIFSGSLDNIANEEFWAKEYNDEVIRIFPAAGSSLYTDENGIGNDDIIGVNIGADFWSSSALRGEDTDNAFTLFYSDTNANVGGGVAKFQGLSVRLIKDLQ